jgi:prepilin-type N-terminal cleavage/methylation domain-containing protein
MRVFGKSDGFTLVELLVACTLLGIAVAGVAGFLQSASFKNNSSKAHTIGVTLAEKAMEEQRAAGYAWVTNGSDTYADPQTGIAFTRSWAVTPNIVAGNLKRIDVTVSWGTGPDRQVQSSLYIARPS